MKLFITGATGFIGNNFLSVKGASYSQVLAPQRADPIYSHNSNIVRTKYSGDSHELCDLLVDFKPDVVVNCAASGISPDERTRKILADVNVGMPRLLYEASQNCDVSAFIQLGSMAEYAAPPAFQSLTETDPITFTNAYGSSKATATSMLATLSDEKGPHTITLRLFGVYGSGEAPHRLTSYLNRALNSGEVVELSQGTQVRDFIYIADVVSAIQAAIECSLSKNYGYEIINIGSGEGISVRNFVENFCDAGGFPRSKLKFGAQPMRDTDSPYLVANIEKARSVLKWNPEWIGKKGLNAFFSG